MSERRKTPLGEDHLHRGLRRHDFLIRHGAAPSLSALRTVCPAAGREVWNRARFPCRAFSLQTLPLGHGCWFPIPPLTASGLSSPSQVCGLSPATLPLSSLLRRAGGRPVSRHEVWRDFFYSSVFYKSKFFIDFDFYFCKISSWTTGKAGNTAPRGQVPTPSPPDIPPERQGGPEQSGCGCKRGPIAS